MAIQIISAPDNNVPKFNSGEPNKFSKLLNSKKTWIVGTVLIILYVLLSGGNVFDIVGYLFLFFLIVFIPSIFGNYFKIFKSLKNHNKVPPYFQQNHDYFKQHLIQKHNFHVTYESVGILVDAQSKRIAFTIDPEVRPQVTVCDFVDVQRWQSYSQGVETQNQYGATQASISKHFVSVYIRNPDHPRYDFFTANDVDADQWLARFDALLN